MNLSFTLEGGLGDYILKYLGHPGNRLASLLKVCNVELRMSRLQKAGHELIKGTSHFDRYTLFDGIEGYKNLLANDISFISNLEDYPKIPISLSLDDNEENLFYNLKRPYAVLHPRASHVARCLSSIFNLHALAQCIADYSGIPLIVLGHESFGYKSHNVIDMTGQGSPRLGCKIVEHASFFVGTHSSMQCAASVYKIPTFCIGPSHILFHDFSAPYSFEEYLKPIFFGGGMFMMFNDAVHFMSFFECFIDRATTLKVEKESEFFRRKLLLTKPVEVHSL
jgi:hypothetical protein